MLDNTISDYRGHRARPACPTPTRPPDELRARRCGRSCSAPTFRGTSRSRSRSSRANSAGRATQVEGVPPEYDYEKIECFMQGVRDYIKYLKRGFGRTTHLVVDRHPQRPQDARGGRAPGRTSMTAGARRRSTCSWSSSVSRRSASWSWWRRTWWRPIRCQASRRFSVSIRRRPILPNGHVSAATRVKMRPVRRNNRWAIGAARKRCL